MQIDIGSNSTEYYGINTTTVVEKTTIHFAYEMIENFSLDDVDNIVVLKKDIDSPYSIICKGKEIGKICYVNELNGITIYPIIFDQKYQINPKIAYNIIKKILEQVFVDIKNTYRKGHNTIIISGVFYNNIYEKTTNIYKTIYKQVLDSMGYKKYTITSDGDIIIENS